MISEWQHLLFLFARHRKHETVSDTHGEPLADTFGSGWSRKTRNVTSQATIGQEFRSLSSFPVLLQWYFLSPGTELPKLSTLI